MEEQTILQQLSRLWPALLVSGGIVTALVIKLINDKRENREQDKMLDRILKNLDGGKER